MGVDLRDRNCQVRESQNRSANEVGRRRTLPVTNPPPIRLADPQELGESMVPDIQLFLLGHERDGDWQVAVLLAPHSRRIPPIMTSLALVSP